MNLNINLLEAIALEIDEIVQPQQPTVVANGYITIWSPAVAWAGTILDAKLVFIWGELDLCLPNQSIILWILHNLKAKLEYLLPPNVAIGDWAETRRFCIKLERIMTELKGHN